MRCSGDVRLRDRGHHLLATDHYRGGTLTARPTLTARGFDGRHLPTDGWTILFRL